MLSDAQIRRILAARSAGFATHQPQDLLDSMVMVKGRKLQSNFGLGGLARRCCDMTVHSVETTEFDHSEILRRQQRSIDERSSHR
jgi:hypothetical protein